MAMPEDWYGLLLARLLAIESELAALEERVKALEDELREAGMK